MIILHKNCDETYTKEKCMVEIYKFPIDEVPDIIAIKRITATEVEVHHVEEDENGKETRCDKLDAHNTKKLSAGMVKWDEVDKAMDTIVKPIESLSKLPNIFCDFMNPLLIFGLSYYFWRFTK